MSTNFSERQRSLSGRPTGTSAATWDFRRRTNRRMRQEQRRCGQWRQHHHKCGSNVIVFELEPPMAGTAKSASRNRGNKDQRETLNPWARTCLLLSAAGRYHLHAQTRKDTEPSHGINRFRGLNRRTCTAPTSSLVCRCRISTMGRRSNCVSRRGFAQ
jgi:hypothetical protein